MAKFEPLDEAQRRYEQGVTRLAEIASANLAPPLNFSPETWEAILKMTIPSPLDTLLYGFTRRSAAERIGEEVLRTVPMDEVSPARVAFRIAELVRPLERIKPEVYHPIFGPEPNFFSQWAYLAERPAILFPPERVGWALKKVEKSAGKEEAGEWLNHLAALSHETGHRIVVDLQKRGKYHDLLGLPRNLGLRDFEAEAAKGLQLRLFKDYLDMSLQPRFETWPPVIAKPTRMGYWFKPTYSKGAMGEEAIADLVSLYTLGEPLESLFVSSIPNKEILLHYLK